MKRLILSLIGIFSLSADAPIEQGRPLKIEQIVGGISQSARFEVRDGWSLGFSLYYNEYAASEDSMEVAYTSNESFDPQGSVLTFDSDYQPGFGLGFLLNTPYDHWNIGGEYLWFQDKAHLSKEADSALLYTAPLFESGPFRTLINSLDSSWDLNINVGDLYLSRPYYSGRNLVLKPVMGLKTAFITQDFDLTAAISSLSEVSWTSQTAKTKSVSWGIGPRAGLDAKFLLGKGFSLFGDLSTSLLYTTFTKIHLDYASSIGQSAFASNNNAQIIQPIIDTGIGFSFGSYALNKSFYVDFSAAYNFSVFFSQNMSRSLVATVNTSSANQSPPANLYLQGVSIGLAFIF